MKVLMVTPTYHPITGGAETAVRYLAIGLNNLGIHTDVITTNMDKTWNPKWRGKTEFSSDGFEIFRIPALNWFPLSHTPKITMGVNLILGRFRNLMKTFDILHFHVGDFSFPLFSLFLQKPKICQLHGLGYDFLRRYFLPRFLLEHTGDLCLSPTEQMKNDLVRLGIPEGRIRYLPNGVDVETFLPSGKKEEGLLLFVGRIDPGKGLHVLLKALAYLKDPVRLVIIGPPGWDLKYFNQLLELIENENLKGKHRVEYIGNKSQKDLVQWYQRASIFVLPPVEYEALGIVNLEALACETPVVATNVGGIPEAIHDGENGILVKPKDPVELANAIRYLLDNEIIRRKFGKEGRELIVNNFSTKTVVRELIEIYEQMIQ